MPRARALVLHQLGRIAMEKKEKEVAMEVQKIEEYDREIIEFDRDIVAAKLRQREEGEELGRLLRQQIEAERRRKEEDVRFRKASGYDPMAGCYPGALSVEERQTLALPMESLEGVDLASLGPLDEAFLRAEALRLQHKEDVRASLRVTLQEQVTQKREAARNQKASDTEFARTMALQDTLRRVQEVKEEAEKQKRDREELLAAWDRDKKHHDMLQRKTRDMMQRSQDFRKTYSASLADTARGALFPGARPGTSQGVGVVPFASGRPNTPFGAGRPETSHASSRSFTRL